MRKLFFVVFASAVIFMVYKFDFGRSGIPVIQLAETEQENKEVEKKELFTLPDYDGKEVSSKDFEGKVLVINSWAVWCPFCKDELDDFAQLQEEFKDEIAVIAIDRAESLSKARGFTDSINVTDRMTFLLDGTDSFYKSIGGFAMPETIFVDTNGNIIVHKRGPMKIEEMREHILGIIN